MASRESVDGKLVHGHREAIAHGAGAFWYVEGGMNILIPGYTWGAIFGEADTDHSGNECVPVNIPFDRWQWDGNREKPTLTPSIMVGGTQGTPEYWHGYMRAGRLESC